MAQPMSASPRGIAGSTSSINLIRSTLARGGEHIGDLAWWSLAEARTDRATLETIWTSSGLDPALLPEPTTAEKALKLAVREAQVGQSERLIRLGKEDQDQLVFAIVHERHIGGGNLLEYDVEAHVALNKLAGDISTDAPGHDLFATIRAAFQQHRHTQTADDVRRSILRVLDRAAAVSLREAGGVYWVPAPHADEARRLQKAVEQIGSSKLHLLPVHRSVESEKTLGEVARGSLETELTALQAEIAEFATNPPSRNCTLVHRLEAFESLKARGQLYRSVLSVNLDDLSAKLSELTQSVEGMLNQKAA